MMQLPLLEPDLRADWLDAIRRIEAMIADLQARAGDVADADDRVAQLRALLAVARRRLAEIDPFGGSADEVLE